MGGGGFYLDLEDRRVGEEEGIFRNVLERFEQYLSTIGTRFEQDCWRMEE